jgi:hypothetical protein
MEMRRPVSVSVRRELLWCYAKHHAKADPKSRKSILDDCQNFFQPSAKLISKKRVVPTTVARFA